jgi:hypothetical protein
MSIPAITSNPDFQKAIAQVEMLPGEEIHFGIKADGFFQGTNPLEKLMARFNAFITSLTGGHIRIFAVVTNKRVLLLQSMRAWCGCSKVESVNAIGLASVREVGMGKETRVCCVHTRTVHMESMTECYTFVVTKLGDNAMRDFVSNLSAVLVANAEKASM